MNKYAIKHQSCSKKNTFRLDSLPKEALRGLQASVSDANLRSNRNKRNKLEFLLKLDVSPVKKRSLENTLSLPSPSRFSKNRTKRLR